MRVCAPIRPSSPALTATPAPTAAAASASGAPARIHTRSIESVYRAPRLQSRIVTRSSWPVTLPEPVAPGAPPYWLKYGRSLMALPARVNSVHATPKNITIKNAAKMPLPPASATTVMQAKLGRIVSVLWDVGYFPRLEQEELE